MTHRKRQLSAEVRLSQRALADVAEIEDYSVRRWGRRTANRYLDDIDAALGRLAENPELLRAEPEIASGLFFYRVRMHVLVCDFDGKTIAVLTVIYTSMDLPARLLELQPQILAESQILRSKPRQKPKKD